MPFVRQTSLTFEAYLGGGSITNPKNNTIAIHSFGRKKKVQKKKTLGKFQIYLQTPIPIQRLPPPEELNNGVSSAMSVTFFFAGNEMSMKSVWSISFGCRMIPQKKHEIQCWAHNPPKQKVPTCTHKKKNAVFSSLLMLRPHIRIWQISWGFTVDYRHWKTAKGEAIRAKPPPKKTRNIHL